jgi:hypothetical protein
VAPPDPPTPKINPFVKELYQACPPSSFRGDNLFFLYYRGEVKKKVAPPDLSTTKINLFTNELY